MRSVRHYWLLPGKVPGDVVGATVVLEDGRMRVQEWVLTPNKMVLKRWLLPTGTVAE
jgi:hypothetical protein